jgi:hypothetical protein
MLKICQLVLKQLKATIWGILAISAEKNPNISLQN